MIIVIDEEFWEYLKKEHADKVNARLNGLTADKVVQDDIFEQEVSHKISEKGQIAQDFEAAKRDMFLENLKRR